MHFDPVDPKQRLPLLEEGILQYWREEDIFKRSVSQRSSAEQFSFYDGPPFATGLPHYGHLLAGTIKDVIPRYQTMRGKRVQRRFGWDCHGLPIENIIEKENDIAGKPDIEKMGTAAFNNLCRSAVQRYTTEWRHVVERMGRWVDMDWDYKTMDAPYMESIWWGLKELHKKDLLYEGYKPMHICGRCATPLSNFEVTLGYAMRQDQSVVMTFPLKDDPNTILLAWTTTPWSLPGNTWLAVGGHIEYVKVMYEGKNFILAKSLVEKVFAGKEYEVGEAVDPHSLVGKRYEPLFPYFENTVIPSTAETDTPVTYGEKVFTVVMYDSVEVSDAEGTGIVHITSCLGEDSYRVAVSEGVDIIHHVTIDNRFIPEVTDFKDLPVKPEGNDPQSTDKAVIENLKERGRYFSHFTIDHSYPHCWRCDSPLLPYTTSSWFVSVEKIKQDLLAANKETQWVPGHLRDGRFGNWLENARDWAISRNRYWGTPLPVWRTEEKNDMTVIGGRDELISKKQIQFSKVTVMRHGESEHNLIPSYESSPPGSNLTKKGIGQAEQAASFVVNQETSLPVAKIYTSPMARCRQTAEIVAKETGAEVVEDFRLMEVDFGEYDGKTVDFSDLTFVKEKRAKKIEENSPESIYHFPGMETWDSVAGRVEEFFEEKLKEHRSDHIIVVTHADLVRASQAYFTKEDGVKLSHQPYPLQAEPVSYYYDHAKQAQLDLHKDTVDDLAWVGSPSDKTVELTLVRHGETDWNKEGTLQGQTDIELNDTGKAQAKNVATALGGNTFDGIVCSDLKRCRETAEIIAKELDLPLLEEMEELRERHIGEWQGQNKKELYPKLGLHAPHATEEFHECTPEGGESLNEFFERGERACSKLLDEYVGKKLLVVTHGGMIRVLRTFIGNLSFHEGFAMKIENTDHFQLSLNPLLKRTEEVLDCWVESGSMPYAQENYPYAYLSESRCGPLGRIDSEPPAFPANFIAEGIDQTRGWFYTLTVLSTAIFGKSPFEHCVVNGTVLAEDGKKMSKRLKNYPDPLEVVDRHGADAVRFTLMSSPAVRAEDLRFSEKLVEEHVRNVLLPLWNTYSFFVTYANAAGFSGDINRTHSTHPLDQWIRAEMQDLVNRMTEELDNYDLSATCGELHESIDALTNWYVRLSRRRFAGKESEESLHDALATLHDVLLTLCQLLAPFCPYITDAIYLNLTNSEHGSIHLTDWPEPRELHTNEVELLEKTRLMRRVSSLGNAIRGEKKIKSRQPLASATIGVPKSIADVSLLSDDDTALLRQELNVKELIFSENPEEIAETIVQVNARAVGPRLGKRVQEVIQAGKAGEFTVNDDGTITILDEVFTEEEAAIVYRGKEGADVAADHGTVVSLNTEVTDDLLMEGYARDLIRLVQRLRKDAGFEFTDDIVLSVSGMDEVLQKFGDLICEETRSSLGKTAENSATETIGDMEITVSFAKA